MKNQIKISLAQLNPTVGDIEGNFKKIILARDNSKKLNTEIIIFPEMFLSGYPIDDLVLRDEFIFQIDKHIDLLKQLTIDNGPAIIIGAPRKNNFLLHNSVYVIDKGKILGIRDKVLLPNEDEFYDNRQFVPGELKGPINIRGIKIGIPICHDIWKPDICECLRESGAELILSINGSTYNKNKKIERLNMVVSRVLENELPFVYLNMLGGQDEEIFDGSSFVLNADKKLVCQLPSFEERITTLILENSNNVWQFLEEKQYSDLTHYDELYNAIILSIRDYIEKNNFPGVVLGMSGGIDSALVASMSVDAIGSENVDAFMLPSKFTSNTSLIDAKKISNNLNIKLENITIENVYEKTLQTLRPIFKNTKTDITEENIQSRIRTLLLMAISNKFKKMLIATSNKSEAAVGYSTIYGDMSGGFSPLKDVWKTDVFELCKWRNKNIPFLSKYKKLSIIPENIISKAPTAELRENQKDTDSLPEYDILDKILTLSIEEMKDADEIINLGFDKDKVNNILKLLQLSEYKRFQSPPGPKLTNKAFGRDRMYPITNKFNFFG